MPNELSRAEAQTESYYDSSDADKFYETVWGGEDIHIGLYMDTDIIKEASHKTVQAMVASLQNLKADSRVIDLGAGYGGSARYLASTAGCNVTCLNISEVQNRRNRELNQQQGLSEKVRVQHGSFEDIPCDSSSMDLVWSQDSFLHSSNKDRVMEEIARITAPGGELIFTDPMQADDCSAGVLQPVYDRLNLDSMGSFAWYRDKLGSLGFDEVSILDLTPQLRNHYDQVRMDLQSRYGSLTSTISTGYMDRMITGLENWVSAADAGNLAWGILHFRKSGKQ
jgi:sarcosine/dimethylglycine N-methyltransferase